METNPNNPNPGDLPRMQPSAAVPKSVADEFTPGKLDRTVIANPLLQYIEAEEQERRAKPRTTRRKAGPTEPAPPKKYDVIIDLNLRYRGGRQKASDAVVKLIQDAMAPEPGAPEPVADSGAVINNELGQYSQQYVFATLSGEVIRKIVAADIEQAKAAVEQATLDMNVKLVKKDSTERAIYRIWLDFKVNAFLNKSISTIKADAAHLSFSALGRGIIWAVLDSGIDREHRHFNLYDTILPYDPDHPDDTYHRDFTATKNPFQDDFGHGTHVAGIIAGGAIADPADPKTTIVTVTRQRDGHNILSGRADTSLPSLSGMAPQCKLVSMKVLDQHGSGQVSSLIAAIARIQEINNYGRDIKIHGVNMSLGYPFDPEWFACGQSPLCVEVNRLVKSGVVVVVAAGNTGYGISQSVSGRTVAAGVALSINDPGNADLAITVGSTHREMPHTYGVSYFSSKGPTGDGRLKPDLLAPGEKIISCAAGANKNINVDTGTTYEYVEDSGTSMAAPHVSGVIAAFLSIRREYIGQPEVVKDIFLTTATDLKRDRYFQGHGLIDLMRAIQSV